MMASRWTSNCARSALHPVRGGRAPRRRGPQPPSMRSAPTSRATATPRRPLPEDVREHVRAHYGRGRCLVAEQDVDALRPRVRARAATRRARAGLRLEDTSTRSASGTGIFWDAVLESAPAAGRAARAAAPRSRPADGATATWRARRPATSSPRPSNTPPPTRPRPRPPLAARAARWPANTCVRPGARPRLELRRRTGRALLAVVAGPGRRGGRRCCRRAGARARRARAPPHARRRREGEVGARLPPARRGRAPSASALEALYGRLRAEGMPLRARRRPACAWRGRAAHARLRRGTGGRSSASPATAASLALPRCRRCASVTRGPAHARRLCPPGLPTSPETIRRRGGALRDTIRGAGRDRPQARRRGCPPAGGIRTRSRTASAGSRRGTGRNPRCVADLLELLDGDSLSRRRIGDRRRYPSLPTSRRSGVFLCPGAPTNPRLSEHAVHGPRRRPDRCHPRMRGLQAPELPDQEVQAQQPGSHHAAQVLQVVPASYRASRDAIGKTDRWPPTVHARGATATPMQLGDDARPRRRLRARLRRGRARRSARAGDARRRPRRTSPRPAPSRQHASRTTRRAAEAASTARRRATPDELDDGHARARSVDAAAPRKGLFGRAADFLRASVRTSCAASSGPTAARSGRAPPSPSGSWSSPAPISACSTPSGIPSSRPSCKRQPSSPSIHVSLVRHQHLFRAREQGQAEPRAPRVLPEPVARGAPGRRPDRDGPGDEGQPEDLGREADHARLRAGEHGPQRGLLAGREGHAGRDRLRRRVQRADPAHPGRGRPPAAPRGRRRRSRAGPSSRSANPSR